MTRTVPARPLPAARAHTLEESQMYRKFFVALAGAVALAVAGVITDNVITTIEWVQIVIATATAVQVWVTANTPGLTWAKTLTAVVLGVANLLIGVIGDGIDAADVAALLVAALTAAGVYQVANTGSVRRTPVEQ